MSRQEEQISIWPQQTDDEEKEKFKSSDDEEDQCQKEVHISDINKIKTKNLRK